MPQVSICTPNLNNAQYLPARLESIANQAFTDWEWIVVDSGSVDGAWEFLAERACHEPRIHLFQAPREGIYPALNRCIQHARGRYIYIAPSDDDMAQDCLEKLHSALETRPDCDMAHCALHVIGDDAEPLNVWWLQGSLFARMTGEWMDRPHIRRAPFDGLLHLSGETVYTSMTQLLIRRSLLDHIGLFDGRWGSVGDFHWGMRAGLAGNTVHVPDTWAGWRRHPQQATSAAKIGTTEHREKIEDMIENVLENAFAYMPGMVVDKLRAGWNRRLAARRDLQRALQERSSATAKVVYLMRQAVTGSGAAWSDIARRITGRDDVRNARIRVLDEWLRSVKRTEYIRPA